MSSTKQLTGSNTATRKRFSEKKSSCELHAEPLGSSTILDKDVKINYQDELVFALFNSMIDIVVDSWEVLPTDGAVICTCDKVQHKEVCGSQTSYQKEGSIESLKGNNRLDSSKRKLSKASKTSRVSNDNSKSSIKPSSKLSLSHESFTKNADDDLEWIIKYPDEMVIIRFNNGDCYEGETSRRVMHGRGKYKWADGTIYEGDFVRGFATGCGTLQYSDLTLYNGEFVNSLPQGYGVINISSSTLRYSGSWKAGKKHGQGWLHYETDDWYDGEWFEDVRQGVGVRRYKSGETYEGDWHGGTQNGSGVFVWCNNDVYSGEWKNGQMCGYGEYAWNTYINRSFTFPVENVYKGNWIDGRREGIGTIYFGYENGLRLFGEWVNNEKHGSGKLTCGNGTVVRQNILFQNDKLVAEDSHLTPSTEIVVSDTKFNSTTEIPIHLPVETTDLSYYIHLAVVTYLDELYKLEFVEDDRQTTTTEFNTNATQTSLTTTKSEQLTFLTAKFRQQQYNVERREMENVILTNLPKLRRLYNKYASITKKDVSNFQPTLVRYFFWQMIRDLNFLYTEYSLVEFDLILKENPNGGLQSLHYPFEEIFFWQFLQTLVCLAWKCHTVETITRKCVNDGVLATIFTKFLNDIVYTHTRFTSASSLFEYSDLLPVKNVYGLYKSLGEPHTARHFLNSMCTPAYTCLCADAKVPLRDGVNAVAIGGNLIYITDEFSSATVSPEEGEHYKCELYTLHSLGSKRIVRCLCNVCPQMKRNQVLVNIEYPLTFLEFYDSLLKCTILFITLKRKKEERLLRLNRRKSGESTTRTIRRLSTRSKRSIKL